MLHPSARRFALCSSLVLISSTAMAQEVALQMGTATFTQTACGSHSPDFVYDGVTNLESGWAIAVTCAPSEDAYANTAVWETVTDLDATQLQFLFTQGPTGHLMGRFRVSITSDDRSTFADGLDNGGDVDASWTILSAPVVTSAAPLSFTVLPDQSILVGGFAGSAVYDVTYTGSFSNVTGIRLEVLEDPSLPHNGPGMQPTNSNLILLEMDLFASGTPAGEAPRDVELLDLDGDGDLDAVTANEGSDDLGLYLNGGTGSFGASTSVALTVADAAPVALARCDLDGDGASDDLAVACASSSTLVLITNPSSASPTRVSLSSGGQRASCVAAGDLDANPLDDVVIGREGLPFSGGAGLAFSRNGASPVELSIPSPHPTQVVRVALGDLDGDGDQDLAALALGAADELLLFAGDGAGSLSFAGALAFSTSGLAQGLCLADLDRDGRGDLAVVQPQLFPPAQTLRLYRRTSSGALATSLFAPALDLPTGGTFATDLAAGDMEDDSIPGFLSRVDVALADAGQSSVALHHGFTGSAFSSSSSPAVGANPVAVALGDLNGDGCDDLVVANQGSNDLSVVMSAPPALAQSFGTSCGGPVLSASGQPTLGNAAFAVQLSNARAVAPALFFYASGAGDLALPPSACHLYLAAPIASVLRFTSSTGTASLPLAVPSFPALLGVDLYFQAAVFRSPGGAFEDTLDLSAGLRLQAGS
ncbi:MAG: VCBS repeat-containing protein [Planctomycetes bacterium]|nr:VCBS repeat-containing protein [Planctomycetota bacterium]